MSYVYELTAPMETVVDMTERDRTEQLSAPVRLEVARVHPVSLTQTVRAEFADLGRLDARPGHDARSQRKPVSSAVAADHGAHGVVGAKILGAVDIEQRGEL